METTGFLDQANDEFRVVYPWTTAITEPGGMEFVVNAPLHVSLKTAEIATGNSPIDIVIFYSVVGTDL